jgi:hypothetical protein
MDVLDPGTALDRNWHKALALQLRLATFRNKRTPVMTRYTGLNLTATPELLAGGRSSAARHVTASCLPGLLLAPCCCLGAMGLLLLLLGVHLLLVLLHLLLLKATALRFESSMYS